MQNQGQELWLQRLASDGFFILRVVLGSAEIDALVAALHENLAHPSSRRDADYAARNLLSDVPAVRQLARSNALLSIVQTVVGLEAFPVRGILFDKVPGANWHVGWHQDTMIPVAERREVAGFGPWSVKAGVVHVKPPAEVLAKMLTLRLHLDGCSDDDGPLRVLPGSHQYGFLSSDAVKEWISTAAPVTCTARCGDVLLMRPLLLHASSPAKEPRHRRVIHLEYAAEALPGGLRWAEA